MSEPSVGRLAARIPGTLLVIGVLLSACSAAPSSPASTPSGTPTAGPNTTASTGPVGDLVAAAVDDAAFAGTAQLQIDLSMPSGPPGPGVTGSGTERFSGDDWWRIVDAPKLSPSGNSHMETLSLSGEMLDLNDGVWILREFEAPATGVRRFLSAVAPSLQWSDDGSATSTPTASATIPTDLAVAYLDLLGAVVQPDTATATVEVQLSADGAPMAFTLTVDWGVPRSTTTLPTYELTVSAALALGAAPSIARPESVWRTWASPTLGYEITIPEAWDAEPTSGLFPSDRFTAPDLMVAVLRERDWPAYQGMAAWEPLVEAQFTATTGTPVEGRDSYDGSGSGERKAWFALHGEMNGDQKHLVVGLETIGYEAWEIALAAPPGHEDDDVALMQNLLRMISPRLDDATWVGALDAGACFDPVSNWIMPDSRGSTWSDGDVPARQRPCNEPHWFEVIGGIATPASRTAQEACGPAFTGYVGRAPEESALSVSVIANRHAPRAGIDYLCVVSDPGGALTSSVQGQDR